MAPSQATGQRPPEAAESTAASQTPEAAPASQAPAATEAARTSRTGVLLAERLANQRRREIAVFGLSRSRRILVLGAAVVLLITVLTPPWQKSLPTASGNKITEPLGYSLLLVPPAYQNDPKLARFDVPGRSTRGVQIDFGRLLLEWAAIGLVVGILWLLLPAPAVQHAHPADSALDR